jgi:protein-tyrosine-phosphatase
MKPLILFVCTGNICRSPMAAALFSAKVEAVGDAEKYRVESAGTWALVNQPASDYAVEMMSRRGLSLKEHSARTITNEMIDDAALIIVMTRDHQQAIAAEFPQARAKIHLMSEFVGQYYDIGDPYGRELQMYEICADDLSQLIEYGYPRIAEWLAAVQMATSSTS